MMYCMSNSFKKYKEERSRKQKAEITTYIKVKYFPKTSANIYGYIQILLGMLKTVLQMTHK